MSCKLGISNIRILFAIEKLASNLAEILKNYPVEIIDQALTALVLHCYCYYSKDQDLPSFEQIKNLTYAQTYMSKDDEKNQEKWVSKLQEYGYLSTDDFDIVVYDGVKNGYLDEDRLHEQAKIIAERLTVSKSHDSFYDAWRVFHDSFKNNELDVIAALTEAFKAHHKFLSLNDLNSTVLVLKALGKDNEANSLIDLYIDDKKSDVEYLAKAYVATPFGEKIDPTMKSKLEVIFNDFKQEKTLYEIFLKIANSDSWSEKEKLAIEQASIDELYQLLKNTSGDDLKKIVKFGFMLTNKKMKEAMSRIRKESTLNKLRTDKYFKQDNASS